MSKEDYCKDALLCNWGVGSDCGLPVRGESCFAERTEAANPRLLLSGEVHGSKAKPSSREVSLELALRTLCELKIHKDKYGKTDLYLSTQPEAWKHAMEMVGL